MKKPTQKTSIAKMLRQPVVSMYSNEAGSWRITQHYVILQLAGFQETPNAWHSTATDEERKRRSAAMLEIMDAKEYEPTTLFDVPLELLQDEWYQLTPQRKIQSHFILAAQRIALSLVQSTAFLTWEIEKGYQGIARAKHNGVTIAIFALAHA